MEGYDVQQEAGQQRDTGLLAARAGCSPLVPKPMKKGANLKNPKLGLVIIRMGNALFSVIHGLEWNIIMRVINRPTSWTWRMEFAYRTFLKIHGNFTVKK